MKTVKKKAITRRDLIVLQKMLFLHQTSNIYEEFTTWQALHAVLSIRQILTHLLSHVSFNHC